MFFCALTLFPFPFFLFFFFLYVQIFYFTLKDGNDVCARVCVFVGKASFLYHRFFWTKRKKISLPELTKENIG